AATCSAIGSSAIPEMRERGYSARLASGLVAAGGTLAILLPPSITLMLYAVAAEQSLGRLFLAGIGPGILLVVMFAVYGMFRYNLEHSRALAHAAAGGARARILQVDSYTLRQRFEAIPRVAPFVILLIGVMLALYGGFATPSETAGLGAVLALILIAVIYGAWGLSDLKPIFASTLSEATMIMVIVGMSRLYASVRSCLHITQSAAEWVVSLHLAKWLLF